MDYTTLITSEHNTQPIFVALVNLFANAMGNIAAVIDSIGPAFNLNTGLGGAQLDVVGEWIGQSRDISGILSVEYFGFSDDPAALQFGEVTNPSIGGRFYDLGDSTTSTAQLADPEYIVVLQAKIIANQYDGSLGQLESALVTLTGAADFTVVDPGNYVVSIVFTSPINYIIEELLLNFDLAPRPAGTSYVFMFQLASWTWALIGNAAATGGTAQKVGGVPAWDSVAYALAAFQQVSVSWTKSETAYLITAGLSSNPSSTSSPYWQDVNYGFQLGSGGSITIYELGVSAGSYGTYAANDTFEVVADGSYVNYLHNGVILRTVAQTGGPFYPTFVMYSPSAEFTNIAIAT